MSTKWNTQIIGQSGGSTDFGDLFKDDYAIVFLQGKNTFGDLVYCYVKVMLPDIKKMHAILEADAGFNPNDFGTVVTAGKGSPTEEVKLELAMQFPMLDKPKPMNIAGQPTSTLTEKKAWDEY